MAPDSPKRTRWTEAELLSLPTGEHDYFDRKSGLLQQSPERLLGTTAKAVCAFANSGGGHLVLGVTDAGVIDGLDPLIGRTSVREWFEQKIPMLLQHELTDFRVHEVIGDPSASQIPVGKVVIVVDVGDSALAPHQCAYGGGAAQKCMYYMRQGGHSVPAPHFYLELLRQRLTNPALEVESIEVVIRNVSKKEGRAFVALALVARMKNTGRVAAYKWATIPEQVSMGDNNDPDGDDWSPYVFERADAPVGWDSGGIALDSTLLPGVTTLHDLFGFGVWLIDDPTAAQLAQQLWELLRPLTVDYRISTETSLSEPQKAVLGMLLDADALSQEVSRKL